MRLLVQVVLLLLCVGAVLSKECVFLHGSGGNETAPPRTTFPSYWGYVQNFVPQCSSSIFIIQETITRKFDDPKLMAAYCDLAVSGSSGKTRAELNGIISNKIVFTHSMGNNILAAGIKHGLCDFDSSSSWYEVSGPMYGSKAALKLDHICNDTFSPLKWVADDMGCCDGLAVSGSYISLQPSYPGLAGLAEILASRVKGAFCGTDAFGLLSSYSVPLDALATYVDYGESNDGMVPISSCAVSQADWGTTISDSFYQGPYNHADATCRNGGNPCAWYTNKY
eukprot:TRINITY_DN632_c0_g1_i2.p1 TRINITY_DN632_c0_g1~~TRINITY_DN632_c0_g1_i2.p1  ORF type:complete len:281 (-),score=46.28 TRINITY_DN632_c0_g1_i2:109-951(-)